jgi:hypothetical protein
MQLDVLRNTVTTLQSKFEDYEEVLGKLNEANTKCKTLESTQHEQELKIML